MGQNTTFVAMIKKCDCGYRPNKNKESIICASFQGLNLKLGLAMSINVFKIQEILLEFQLNAEK